MEGAPWRSHRSSRVELDRRPPAIEGWKLMMPTAFPPRTNKKQAGNEHSKAARQRMAKQAKKVEAMKELQDQKTHPPTPSILGRGVWFGEG